MENCVFSCVDCGTSACAKGTENFPEFCPTKKLGPEYTNELVGAYREDEFGLKVMREAAETTSRGITEALCRAEEIMDFSRRMGFKKIGIASCFSFTNEARIFARVLRVHGYDVYGVACKAGALPKSRLDAEVDDGCATCENGPVSCNPMMQARLLNEAGTELNVVMGLCLGHDLMFQRYAEAPSTTLIVKDRATVNNPAAALMATNMISPYKRLLREDPTLNAADALQSVVVPNR